MPSMQRIIGIVVSLIIIATVLPIGLVYIANIGNVEVTIGNTTQTTQDWLSGTGAAGILALATNLIPLMIVIGLVLAFIPVYKWYKNRAIDVYPQIIKYV